MNRKTIIILTVMGAIVLAGTVFYFLNNRQEATKTQTEQQNTSKQPAQSSNNMANMPGMGTPNSSELTPPTNLPTINIPYDKQQMIGVQTGTAFVQPMMKQIRTVGRVSYDEKKLATVNTKFDGYIEKLYINTTGEYVRKGQPMAEIYSPELLATQMEFINLVKWRHNDKTTSNYKDDIDQMLSNDAQNVILAAKQRLKLFDITDKQIDAVERTGQPKRTLTVYSPINGYVIQRQALQGTRVQPGQALFDVADLSTVWILADIYEQDLPLIREGQKAAINFPYYPGKTFIATINYVYPTLDNVSRTAKARFTIPNSKGIFKPQMYSDMEISIGLGNQLAVPESAVINTGKRQIVYVDLGNGNFQQRQVKTGLRVDGMIQILSGIKAGEVVSTSANFLIDSEARLKGSSQ
jgi:Cu(I)/Ag(I) efflux system membrane fusion protein